MRLKSFYGPNMTEAMREVRESLGDNAIIVATRDDDMGGVRVTVAIDEPPKASLPSSASVLAEREQEGSESIEVIASSLLSHQAPQALAERLLATATQFASEDTLLALGAALDTHFSFAPLPDDRPEKPLMLVGPPGAGKTLCAAKLAAKAAIAKKKLAVVSTDTQRAGGMAQLAAFARVMEKDIFEIEDAHALGGVVSVQPPETLVLIDTAGCNPFVESERAALAALIKASDAMPVLVLPADQDSTTSIEMAREFLSLGAKSLLFTRLDLARRVGGLLRTSFESRLPLAAFTATAKVTEAPAPMNPVSLARLILPKEKAKEQKAQARSA